MKDTKMENQEIRVELGENNVTKVKRGERLKKEEMGTSAQSYIEFRGDEGVSFHRKMLSL